VVHPLFLDRLEAVAGRTRSLGPLPGRIVAIKPARIAGLRKFSPLRGWFARDRRLGAVTGAIQQRIALKFFLDCRNSNLCVSAMEAGTDPVKVGPILALA
jgi:hypothetical protein